MDKSQEKQKKDAVQKRRILFELRGKIVEEW